MELISGDDVIPEDTPYIAKLRGKWKIKCGKALFALRTSTGKKYIEHVRNEKSPKQVCESLERLLTQKNTMRLLYLENELVGMIQGSLSVLEYFLTKTLCAKISELYMEFMFVDCGKCVVILFVDCGKCLCPLSIRYKGWANQHTIIELENQLSDQEALVKQMSSISNKSLSQVEDVLYTKSQRKKVFFFLPLNSLRVIVSNPKLEAM